MKILITGAAGFLGRRLAAALAATHQVTGVYRQHCSIEPIDVVGCDLSKPFDTASWPDVDVIYHLAQSAKYADFPNGASEVFAVATSATQTLLDYAVRVRARKFIFASTGGFYKAKHRPVTEDDVVSVGGEPLSHYFAAKQAAELLIQSYRSHIDGTSVRLFFCYGPGQSSAMLFPRLERSIREHKQIRIAGENGATMNPIFVDDAAAIFAGLANQLDAPILNLAGPRTVCLREICYEIGAAAGIAPLLVPDLSIQAPSFIADTSELKRLKLLPMVDPIDGIRLTFRV